MSTTSTPKVPTTPAATRKAQESALASEIFTLMDSRDSDYAVAQRLFEMNKELTLDGVLVALNTARLAVGLLSVGRSTLANLVKAWSLSIEAGVTPTPNTVSAARKAITMGSASARAKAVESVKKLSADKREAAFIKAMVAAKSAPVKTLESKVPAPVVDGAPADKATGPTEQVSVDAITAQIKAWSALTLTADERNSILAAMQAFAIATSPAATPVATAAKRAKVAA